MPELFQPDWISRKVIGGEPPAPPLSKKKLFGKNIIILS